MTSNDGQLFLNTKNPQYKISPLVVFSILSHYQRRPDKSPSPEYSVCDFVVGLLFGYKEKGSHFYVTSSFPLSSYQTTGGKLAVPSEQISRIIDLHFQGHSKDDKLIGWYKTGLNLNYKNVSMHELLQGEDLKIPVKRKVSDEELLQLLVDTELIDDTMRIKGYVGYQAFDPLESYFHAQSGDKKLKAGKNKKKQKKKEDATSAASVSGSNKEGAGGWHWKFDQVVVDYHTERAEEIALHTTLNTPPDGTELDAPSSLLSDMGDLENTLEDLVDRLGKVSEYVQSVRDSTRSGDESLGWVIAETLSAIPTISPTKFEKILSTRLQDLLMLAYLGKLTRTQLKIADKINHVLHQTIQE